MESPASRVAYEFGEFRIDAVQRLLRSRADGEPIALTPKVFETLLYLVEHPGELVEKATLMKAIWPNVIVEENNLNQNISILRRVLGENAAEHRFIVTVPGRGYRFVAAVSKVTTRGEPPAAATQGRGARSAESGHVAVPSPSGVEPQPDQTYGARLAVLPFANLSPDPANAFFTDGLHEETLATLARKAPGLEVVSRTTMMGYRLNPKSVHEIAKEVGASHVLEGSVRREADTVRLTLQLIDARADRHLWSSNFDRTLHSALTLQSEVAREVAAQLSVQLAGGAEPDVPLTRNPEAYDLYLKGLLARQFVGPLAPVEEYEETEELFSRAIELDPTFVAARAQRATFRAAVFAFNYDVSEEQVSRIRADVEAGSRLAPDDPLVLAAEALYWSRVERELPRALAAFEAAEAAHLADPTLLTSKAYTLLRVGRPDEACRLMERIAAVDPGNPFIVFTFAASLSLARRPAVALRTLTRALEQFPGNTSLEFARAQIIFGYAGRSGDWRAILDQASRTLSPALLIDAHFTLLRIERRYDELRELLDRIAQPSVRVLAGPGAGTLFGVGQRPTAQYRGWVALLQGDRASAMADGRAVLDFVASQKETARNAWFLRTLEGQGYTFLGQYERATASARHSLELMPRTRDTLGWIPTVCGAAATYAWSGAADEAIAVLEALSTARPGPGPGFIVRDPLFSVPLSGHTRYRALADRLEAELRAAEL